MNILPINIEDIIHARRVPFDDRAYENLNMGMEVLSPALVMNFLSYVGTRLIAGENRVEDQTIYHLK